MVKEQKFPTSAFTKNLGNHTAVDSPTCHHSNRLLRQKQPTDLPDRPTPERTARPAQRNQRPYSRDPKIRPTRFRNTKPNHATAASANHRAGSPSRSNSGATSPCRKRSPNRSYQRGYQRGGNPSPRRTGSHCGKRSHCRSRKRSPSRSNHRGYKRSRNHQRSRKAVSRPTAGPSLKSDNNPLKPPR